MRFKDATDELMAVITTEDVAEGLGCSKQTIKQARLKDGVTGYRSPPASWEAGIARLAEQRIAKLKRLAEKMRAAAKMAAKG
jgi:hypothetical protein